MTGADFIAVRRLSDKANVTLADEGQTCERVPAAALAHLYAGGKIVAAVRDDKPSPVAAKARGRKSVASDQADGGGN